MQALTCSTYTCAQAFAHTALTLIHSTHVQHVHSCTSARTRSTYTCAQHSHTACTLVHKRSDTQHVHSCTSTWTCSPYTRAQHSQHVHLCTSAQTCSMYTCAQHSHTARTLVHKRLDTQHVHMHKHLDTQPVHACTALTHSTYTLAQALRHAARTRVHSTQTCSPYTHAQHSDTARTRVHTHTLHHMCTLTQAAIYMCLCTHSSFPQEAWGLARGGGRCVPHPPCNTRLGPRWSGTSQTGSQSSSAGSTSAQRSWLWRVQPLSGMAPLAGPWVPLPHHPGWSRHCPSVDQNRPLPSGQVGKVPLASRQLPGRGRRPVGVRASSQGHHPWISRLSAGSLGQLQPWATVSRKKAAGSRPATPHPPATSPQEPRLPGARARRPSLTTLNVEGTGVLQPVQLVIAARLGLPGVGEAGARGLHQPPGCPEVVPFEAIEVPAEA